MDFDFAMILFLASVFTGGVWAIDALLGAPSRRAEADRLQREGHEKPDAEKVYAALKEPTLVEYCKSFFPVILVVFLLRSFLVEPFRIPSGSMMPTLLAGDFILVDKFAYGFRLPVVNRKIVEMGSPQRGDVVVFRYPKQPSVDYIKRVVGLAGDRITYSNKAVHVNGQPVPQIPAGTYTANGAGISMIGADVRRERLGEIEHDILVQPNVPGRHGEFIVPPGHYFVMGDNRDNSNDSRYWGSVPEANLVGRAFMIWMNWDGVDRAIQWSRIGESIR